MLGLRPVLLALAVLLAPAAAHAQAGGGAAVYDPQQLPAIRGRVAQYSLTPRGDVDGLILEDGTQLHLPPHLGPLLVQAVRPGDAVTARGLRARSIPVVQAMQVVNDATGQTVSDRGPADGPPGAPRQAPERQMLDASGRSKAWLYGPRGEVNGVLLEDGTQLHLPPPEVVHLAAELAPGQAVFARGPGVEGPLGRVIDVQVLGPTAAQAVPVGAPAR